MTISKKTTKKILAGVMASAILMTSNVQQAEACWDILNRVIGTAVQYENTRNQLLQVGNDPVMQAASYEKAGENQGANRPVDEKSVILTDEVMNRLIADGNFALKNNSLPFRWRVVANDEFNASCNATDFIKVHDALVMKCNYNPDELAAVLAHEMTHGYNQHIVNKASKRVLANFAGSIAAGSFGGEFGVIGATITPTMMNFLTVKNLDVGLELSADQNGFYTMASAGFNPGGTCAMLARMKYYTDHADQVKDFFNPAQHPDTERRQKDAAKHLYNYGIDHAKVKNIDMVYFDDKFLLRAEEEGGLDQEEMAYLIVGSISKAFHDYKTVEGWNFHRNEAGNIDYLNDSEVYGPLKRAIARLHCEAEFQALVETAYQKDLKDGKREKCLKTEEKYKKDVLDRINAESEKKEDSSELADNGNIYLRLGLVDYADTEYTRAQSLDIMNPAVKSGKAMVMSARGDYDSALALANEAIKMNAELGSGYTARAQVYKDMGEMELAMADCRRGYSATEKDNYAHKMAGDIFNLLDDHASALAEYKSYKAGDKYVEDIPDNYKQELAAK